MNKMHVSFNTLFLAAALKTTFLLMMTLSKESILGACHFVASYLCGTETLTLAKKKLPLMLTLEKNSFLAVALPFKLVPEAFSCVK